MRLISDVSESDVVRAFLSADLGSPRTSGQLVANELRKKRLHESDLARTSISEKEVLELRSIFQTCHGGTVRDLPFADTTWHRAQLVDGDCLHLMDYREFRDWTGGTLRPQDAAAGFREHRGLDDLVAKIDAGRAVPALICVARSEASPPVVLDGSARAVALEALSILHEREILLGISQRMNEWYFFPNRLM
ncbi:MAG: hypothetical protein ABL953_09490 [Ilumatobacteraceae bacterium]